MRWLKNPMANAAYVALITAIYAAIFIVSSELVMSYENLLSDSGCFCEGSAGFGKYRTGCCRTN